jgi:cytidyltransferase-like protein
MKRQIYKDDGVVVSPENGKYHIQYDAGSHQIAMRQDGIGEGAKRGGSMSKRIGVYPGTFDPITLGHMDIIERGAKLVDELIIGVTTNIAKTPMFNDDERIAMVKREVAAVGKANIRVVGFNSLLMDFALAQGANVVIRSIRGVTDFEYEY